MYFYMLVVSISIAVSNQASPNGNEKAESTNYLEEHVIGDDLNFMILGDFGGFPPPFYKTNIQTRVAGMAGQQAKEHNANFVIALGDNFYFSGVKSIYDKRWRATFEDVYTDESLYVPWYPTMGNHDWVGSAQAQLDYSEISSRWTYPWYWYTVDYYLDHNESETTKLRIISFDTTITCGIGSKPVNGPLDASMSIDQWAWLEQQLIEGQDADYIMVIGHYPIYSAGNAGPYLPCLERLNDLLKTYQANIYLSGHDHGLQHLTEPTCDLNEISKCLQYSVVGCSNFVSQRMPYKQSAEFNTIYAEGNIRYLFRGGFARGRMTADGLMLYYYEGKNGDLVHTLNAAPRDLTFL